MAFYPTRIAILAAAAVAPAALVVGILVPAFWTAGLGLLLLLLALALVDAFAGPSVRSADVACDGPGAVGVGDSFAIVARLAFPGRPPARAEVAIGIDQERIGDAAIVSAPHGWRAPAPLDPDARDGRRLAAVLVLRAERRGAAKIEGVWIRWPGPLGLVFRQRWLALDQAILVAPDIRAVREKSAQMVNRDAHHGLVAQLQVGEGAEFEALADYRQGMDRRAIDWKTSARHTRLVAKEYRTERNNHIVMALDAGRVMCEPILPGTGRGTMRSMVEGSPGTGRGTAAEGRGGGAFLPGTGRGTAAEGGGGGGPQHGAPGPLHPAAARRGPPPRPGEDRESVAVPRIDKAVSAALLTAFVALRDGDRVGLFSFDSKPRAASNPISGPRAFPMLQRVAAGIDYSSHETNYTLAMATLASSLNRRSLIVVFTEFADTISAELMLNAVGTLLGRHLVLFVVFRDEELEAFTAAEPASPDDVSRAVTAATLLRERALVLTRLRHMGVHVIEAAADQAGPALVAAYLDLKRRDLL